MHVDRVKKIVDERLAEIQTVRFPSDQMDEIKEFLENYIDEQMSDLVADMKESTRTAIAQINALSEDELKQVRELIAASKADKDPETGRE